MDRATKVAAVVIVILVAAGAAIYIMNEHPGSDIVYHDTLDALESYGSEGDVVSECTFDEPGFTFVGWNTSSDGSGTTYMPGDTIGSEGKVHLYAQWVKSVYRVTYGTGTDLDLLGESIVLRYSDGTEAPLEEGARLDGHPSVVVRGDVWDWTYEGNNRFLGTDDQGRTFELLIVIAGGEYSAMLQDGDPTYQFEIDSYGVFIVYAPNHFETPAL